MGLPCMNCKRDAGSGKFFAEAYVCGDCYAVASRLFEQGNRELNQVLVTLKELIRVAIIEGRLSFAPPPEEPGDVQPRRAIDVIVDMMKEKSCRDETSQPTTASDAPTPAVAGQQSSDSTQASALPSGTPSTEQVTGESDIA